MTNLKPLDLRGLSCPVPQMKALDAIHARRTSTLEILADIGGGAESVIRTVKTLGLRHETGRLDDESIRIVVLLE